MSGKTYSITNISVLCYYLGLITLVWCELFALWMCSSHFTSCFRGLLCCIISKSFTYSYRHNLVLHCIVSNLYIVFAGFQTIHVYADLPGMHASVSPQATIPPTLIVTFYHPAWHCDLQWIHQFSCTTESVFHSVFFFRTYSIALHRNNSIALTELTSGLGSFFFRTLIWLFYWTNLGTCPQLAILSCKKSSGFTHLRLLRVNHHLNMKKKTRLIGSVKNQVGF